MKQIIKTIRNLIKSNKQLNIKEVYSFMKQHGANFYEIDDMWELQLNIRNTKKMSKRRFGLSNNMLKWRGFKGWYISKSYKHALDRYYQVHRNGTFLERLDRNKDWIEYWKDNPKEYQELLFDLKRRVK